MGHAIHASPKCLRVAEMDYGPEETEALRQEVIRIRNTALKDGDMRGAIVLSHAVALLAGLRDEVWPPAAAAPAAQQPPGQPGAMKCKPQVRQVTHFIASHRTGRITGLDQQSITGILGVAPNTEPSGDGKVTCCWNFTADGAECSIWDYKGSAHYNQWSTFGSPSKLVELFGNSYTAER